MPPVVSLDPVEPDHVVEVARAVLAVPYLDIHTTPVGQTLIGWIRGSHDQILAVGELVSLGHITSIGPNIRTIMDVVLRLLWLRSLPDRAAGLRGQFAGEARQADLHLHNLQKMKLPITIVESPPEIDLDQQFGSLDTKLQGLAARVLDISLDASKQATGVGGFYDTWHTASQFTHATMALAEAYAPRTSFGNFTAPGDFPNLAHDRLNAVSMVICSIAAEILIDEGLDQDTALTFLVASATV